MVQRKKRGVKKFFMWGGIILLIACVEMFGNVPAYSASKKVITIGLLSCISGPQAVIGNTCRFGAEQAVEYVNKEQLLGKNVKLKLLVADDQLNATVGLNAYQGFKDKILAFAGYDTSGCSALRPFVEQDKKPFVALTTNRTFIYPPSKYVFGVAPPYEEILVGFLKAIKSSWRKSKPPKLGLISFETPSGRVPINAARKYGPEIGWEIKPVSIVSPTTVDFSEAIARIKADKPDWVLLSLTGGQIKSLLKQARATGIKDMTKWLLPLWGGFTESTTKVVPTELLNGVYGFCLISNPSVHNGAKAWAAWTKKNSGKECDESGNSGAVGVFLITKAIQLTLEKVSFEELNGPNLVKHGFERIRKFQMFGDLMPPITYGPNLRRGITKGCVLRMVNGHVQGAIPWFDIPSLGL
ncbi:MAG TPA: ABC transporter substrate-binding protein [Thermococcus sp.]|nr:ABC transporter substrate-binding protein [Thermococcus sp.]